MLSWSGNVSVLDNVLIGGHIDFKASGFEQALRLPRARREEKQMREKAGDVLRFMGIAELKDALVAGQPYGIRKKVEMARTLMCNPKLIILDEPAAGLNDVETQQLAVLIFIQVREQIGCAFLPVRSTDIWRYCYRVYVIEYALFHLVNFWHVELLQKYREMLRFRTASIWERRRNSHG